MKTWKVILKRFSEIEKGFVWVEDFIESDGHRSTQIGVLEFINNNEQASPPWPIVIQSIPPGCWMGVEQKKDQQ